MFRFTLLICGLLLLFANVSEAGSKKFAAIAIDTETNSILYSYKADQKRYPASLTKLMTLYLTFEAIENNELTLTQEIKTSRHAATRYPTKIYLRIGEKITVQKAIDAVIIHSANDAAVVLAEAIAESEEAFAKKMTAKAKELGMENTVFKNATGLPNWQQVTTAHDMSKLSLALYEDFPEYYSLFKKVCFTHRGKVYYNHNRLNYLYSGADGLKTGFTKSSGYNLATSAERKGKRVFAVVLGGEDSQDRDNRMIRILNKSFRKIQTRIVFAENKVPVPTEKPQPNITLASNAIDIDKTKSEYPRTYAFPIAQTHLERPLHTEFAALQ